MPRKSEARYDYWYISACNKCGLLSPSVVCSGFPEAMLKDEPGVGDMPGGTHCGRCWDWTEGTVISVFQQKVRGG